MAVAVKLVVNKQSPPAAPIVLAIIALVVGAMIIARYSSRVFYPYNKRYLSTELRSYEWILF